MGEAIRVMVERGSKKPVAVAVALDWPGWNRSGTSEAEALKVLDAYRPRYAKIAKLAGLAKEFRAAGELSVVERLKGSGMTDFYALSYRSAGSEHEPISDAACERKIALLRASWTYFDSVASRVSAELRKGPRGGGRDRDKIIRHANGAEIHEFARKVGVNTPLDARERPAELRVHREAFCAAIRDYNARGAPARTWTVQFVIRHAAYHMLDHAWEMEDRDLSGGS
jgi:hypothetical protein